MLKSYNNDEISQFMLNEDHLKKICQVLVGYKINDSIYTLSEIVEDELRFSISKNMNDEIVKTEIYIIRNLQPLLSNTTSQIEVCFFFNDKIILNTQIMSIEELNNIILPEMRDIKLNELLL